MAEPTVNWITGIISVPKSYLTLVQASPTEIYNLDLNAFRLSLRDLEDDPDGRPWTKTHSHNTEVTLSGLNYARVIEILDPYTITFEDGQYAVNLIGANSNVADKTNVNQVSIRPQNSAGLISSQAIEFGEYGEAVTLDVVNGFTGQVYPTGTRRRPSNNVPDMNNIATFYGFNDIKVLEDTTFGTTNLVPDDIRGYHIIGVSHVNTTIVVEPEALCLKTAFSDCKISGTLDGDSEIRDCVVDDLVYFNGHIHDSYLNGTITLAGSLNANIENCSILDFAVPPTINAGGFGQDLMMPNYSGILIITNLTGNSNIGIGLDAGQVIIDSSCTAGVVQVSGTGSVVDNSGPDCYVIDSIINGTDVQNLSRLIELLRPHHTGTGDMWFWDPYGGNDAWDGKHQDRATKTFAQAHTLAQDNNHDIIVCVSGDPSGTTITNEIITISKNYLFVRGPGRDFRVINTLDDNVPTINITSNGVEISGMIIGNNQTNVTAAVRLAGLFPLLQNVWIEGASNGVLTEINATNGILNHVDMAACAGYGLRITGATSKFTIESCRIGNNGSNGVEVDIDTGSKGISFEGHAVIQNNGGYGITVSATTDTVVLGASINVFANALGHILDLGINTQFTQLINHQRTASYVWGSDLTVYPEGTAGSYVNHLKNLEYKVFVNPEEAIDGDGSQHRPFNNETSAIDFSEAHGVFNLRVMTEITFTRQIKNFFVDSVNIAKVNTNGQNLDGSRFQYVTIDGVYTGIITAQESQLISTSVTSLNGNFENCGLGSNFEVPDGGYALVKNCTAITTDFTKPIISIGGVSGTAQLALMWYIGGVTITNCNQTTDIVKIVTVGIVELDATCTDGNIIIFGNVKPVDNSGVGCTVQWINVNPEELKDIHLAAVGRRQSVGLVDTIYEADLITPRKAFDITKSGNGEVIEIVPQ